MALPTNLGATKNESSCHALSVPGRRRLTNVTDPHGRSIHAEQFAASSTLLIVNLALLKRQIEQHYPQLGTVEVTLAYSYVHEIFSVTTSDDVRYALKLYRVGVRTDNDLRWETSFHNYLFAAGAPVVELIAGIAGSFQFLDVEGIERFATLTRWAPGSEPRANVESFRLLGQAAARFHNASEGFVSDAHRDVVDLNEIIDRPLTMLKPMLRYCNRWEDVVHMAQDLRLRVVETQLDWGICHNDLGLRNVCVDGDQMLIFDLDGSTAGFRALEGVGAFEADDSRCWPAWLSGYREVRDFSSADERIVPTFALLAQFQRTAWKLGLTDISVGRLMAPDELPAVVEEWLEWANR